MVSPAPYIRIRNLSKSFGEKKILQGIDLDVYEKESFVIIGGSGTGKSVLIKCIMGLMEPDSGLIEIDGQNVSHLSVQDKQKLFKNFGVLFQGGALFDSMSVWENIVFSLLQNKKISKQEGRAVALERLKAVDMNASVMDVYPAELSGGMQKRVALARATVDQPKIIFFDEPTTGLDPIVSGTINDLIRRSVTELGSCALTITHDMNSLRKIADRVGLLFNGKIIWQGTVEEMDHTDNSYVDQFIHGKSEGPFTSS
jgi:phospholipid/cholesterol/gamma-HCH transport system ATP-binding protein